MNKPKFLALALTFIFLLSFSKAFAQPEQQQKIEPSFEIILQTLVASNDARDKGNLPDSLSAIVSKLKTNFAFSNFKIISTHLDRIANKGSLNFRTVLNGLNQDEAETVSSNWGLSNINSSFDAKGRSGVEFSFFSFDAQFPYKTTIFNEKTGGMVPVIGSDSIALKIQNLSFPENEPTLIGSLVLPKTDKQIFLIITIKPY